MRQWVDGVRLRGLSIALLTAGAIGWSGIAWAQNITLDGTLGRSGTLTGPFYLIQPADGRTVGRNLFHSFGRFNLTSTEAAFFLANPDIRNILARVTGGTRSTIDGLITTLTPTFQKAGVNLFLINPSGILFGPNARLNIGNPDRGSFVATTTDALVWPDGSRFSATNPNSGDSLLRIVGDPSGFLATQRNLRPIEVRGSTTNQGLLAVYPGNSLVLVGGGINVENTLLSWYIPPAGGLVDGIHIGIAGMAGAGILGLNVSGNQLSLQVPDELPRANISIEKSTLFSRAGNSGSISVYANNLNLLNGTQLLAGIDSDSGSTRSQSGDINLNATENIVVAGKSWVLNNVQRNALGNGGDVNVTAKSLQIKEDSVFSAGTLGQGQAGKVTVQVENTTVLDAGKIYSNVIGKGNSGGVYISTGSLLLTNSANIQSNVAGEGNSGGIKIQARDSVSLDGAEQISNTLFFPSALFSRVLDGGEGNSGGISITARSLNVTNRAQIASVTQGIGNAGTIFIDVQGQIYLLNSIIISEVTEGLGQGDGGNITIKADSLILKDGSALLADTEYKGDAGKISIEAGSVILEGQGPGALDLSITVPSQISTTVESNATGNGGGIDIQTGLLLLRDEGFINSTTYGAGRPGDITLNVNTLSALGGSDIFAETNGSANAGRLTITAQDLVEVVGQDSFLSVDTNSRATGQGGELAITAKRVSIRDGGTISTNTFGRGNAGRLSITASDSVEVIGRSPDSLSPSQLSASASRSANGNGGDLFIQTKNLSIGDGAQVSVSSQGVGEAGRLNITANSVRLNNRGSILATTSSGNGGNIFLNLKDLLLMRNGSNISTTAGTAQAGGNGGNITIDSPNGFIVGVLRENSDITANAFTGSGGNVNITAQGIYGLKFQPRLTPNSDITASSEFGFSGTVTLNLPDTDPSRGFISLPNDLSDPTTLLDTRCQPGSRGYASSYIETGRSGIPASPDDLFTADPALPNWVMPPSTPSPSHPITPPPHHSPTPDPLTDEANTLLRAPDGSLHLVRARSLSPVDFWRSPDCAFGRRGG